MTQEEIKKYIKEQIDKCYVIEHKEFEKVDLSKLLDYITNLQEENKKLLKIKKYAEEVGNKRNELYDRIDKAIEWLDYNEIGNWFECSKKDIEDLLNILKGDE